jgi:hypothetical protein
MIPNRDHEVIATRLASVWLVNRTLIHQREVYTDAIQEGVVSNILAHNHLHVSFYQIQAIFMARLVSDWTVNSGEDPMKTPLLLN